jgi:hypothetical protein
VTRGRAIAWVVSLALGVGWAVLLGLLPGDDESVAALLIGITGLLGLPLGVLIATGLLVRVFRMLGNPTRAVSTSPGELPADLGFGVCVILFSLPSLIAYLGWSFQG